MVISLLFGLKTGYSMFLKLFRMPHKCHGNAKNCPSRAHDIWEMPINELDRRDDPTFDEQLTGCHLVSSCSNIYYKDQFRSLLQQNFVRHYSTNRAPLSLSFDPAWLISNKVIVYYEFNKLSISTKFFLCWVGKYVQVIYSFKI